MDVFLLWLVYVSADNDDKPLNRASLGRRSNVLPPPPLPYCWVDAVVVVVVVVVVMFVFCECGIWDDSIAWDACGVLLWSGVGVILALIEDVLAVAVVADEVVVVVVVGCGDDDEEEESSCVAVSVAASLARLWGKCLLPTMPRTPSTAALTNALTLDKLSEVMSLTCELEVLLLVLPRRLYPFRGPSLMTELSEL